MRLFAFENRLTQRGVFRPKVFPGPGAGAATLKMPKGVKFTEEAWFREAAEIMIKERINLRRAAEQLGQVLLPEEAQAIFRRKLFQVILQQAKNDFYADLGRDQNRTKDILVGRMLDAIDRLAEEGQSKDVTLAVGVLSKILGFSGAETEVNVMGSLSQEDIDKLKNEIRTRRELLSKKPSDGPAN